MSFLVRPIGGMVFGPMGDKIGRKKVLALTMITMAIGTCAIGLIPSYAAIGFWAPVLPIFFRLVQGFSTGGEYGGASTFIAEYALDKRRGFYGSFLELGTLAGYVGAAGLVTLMTSLLGSGGMESWGWRVPFLVAGPLGLVGLYLRLRLDETPAFRKLEDESLHRASDAASAVGTTAKGDLAKIFRDYWPTLILCICLVGAYNIADYMLLSYMPTYLSDEMGYSDTHGLLVLIATMAVLMLIHVGDAARAVPDPGPLRLPVRRLQPLRLPLRRHHASGDHGADLRHRKRTDARVLRHGRGRGRCDRRGVHEGDGRSAACGVAAVRRDAGRGRPDGGEPGTGAEVLSDTGPHSKNFRLQPVFVFGPGTLARL